MQYRRFGNKDFEVSALGFGCMRLPILDNDMTKIDEQKAKTLIRYAIDNGVNYIDTAFGYHGGKSESIVGRILKDGYREKVNLVTKLPIWKCYKYEDFESLLNKQLERLDTDHLDLYMLHNVERRGWARVRDLGVIKFLEEARDKGKIKYIGFSFHDGVDVFKEILDYYNWDFCQVQFNYMDTEYQAGIEGVEYAGKKGIPVIVMEPLKGGLLAKEPPDDIKKIWHKSECNDLTPAQRGLKWVMNFPQVVTVLSGMNEMEQLKENIDIACKALPNCMSKNEMDITSDVRNRLKELNKVPCTSCQYCMPCPAGVDIPMNFDFYNTAYMHNAHEEMKARFKNPVLMDRTAVKCVSCGKCLEKCPQHINIPEMMKIICEEWK